MTGGGGGTTKSERKEKRLDAKGERLMAKEVKRFDKDINSTDPKKIASRYGRSQVYQEKMGLIEEGIKPKGKMISKVKSNATEKLQKLATKESKKVSKMGQDAYWATSVDGSTTGKPQKYYAKRDKVESKAKEKVNKIIQKRAK